jgi:chromosome segregation ATPase
MSFKEPTPYAALQAENKELLAKNEKLKKQTVFLQDHNNTLQTRCRHRNEEIANHKRKLIHMSDHLVNLRAKCARYEETQAINEKALDEAAGAVLDAQDNVEELNEQCQSQATIIEALKVENQKQAKIIELLQGPEEPLRAENAALRAENERLKAVCDRGEALVALRNQELEQKREELLQARNTIMDCATEAQGQIMMVQALENENKELKDTMKAKDAFIADLQTQVRKTVARRIDTAVLHTMTSKDDEYEPVQINSDKVVAQGIALKIAKEIDDEDPELAWALADSLKLASMTESEQPQPVPVQPEPEGKIDTGLLTTFYQNTKPDQP